MFKNMNELPKRVRELLQVNIYGDMNDAEERALRIVNGLTACREDAINALDNLFDKCEEIDAHLPAKEQTGYNMMPDITFLRQYLNFNMVDSNRDSCRKCKFFRGMEDTGEYVCILPIIDDSFDWPDDQPLWYVEPDDECEKFEAR